MTTLVVDVVAVTLLSGKVNVVLTGGLDDEHGDVVT